MVQYQREERALIAHRLKSSPKEIADIITCMENDSISTEENILSLKTELSKHYNNQDFLKCNNMGQILRLNLQQLLTK